jgi:hypothetical protein
LARRTLLTVAVFLAAVSLAAQVDIATSGPQVGGRAIDFSLIDQTGKTQTLKTVAGPKGTMLVFFRSADW